MIDSRFKEERQYTAAIITEKLRPLESKIDRLFETETEDVQAVASDVVRLDKRVTKIEQRLELHA